MKKAFILAVLPVLLACALCACGGAEETPDPAAALYADPGQYTIAVLSDTQFMSKEAPDSFSALGQFLTDRREQLGLAYLVHTGDIVNNPLEEAQWQAADAAMSLLDGNIPYGVLAGNHDQGNNEERFTLYNKYFGPQRWAETDYYGESLEGNRAHYDLISAGETDFIFVYLSDDPDKACVDFANAAFAAYPERIGVLCLHNYITDEAELSDMGEYFQAQVVAVNSNVRLVLCGHADPTACLSHSFDDDQDGTAERQVLQIISNYQDGSARNAGYMLFLRIDQGAGTLEALTYSPLRQDYTGHEDEAITDEFVADLPF